MGINLDLIRYNLQSFILWQWTLLLWHDSGWWLLRQWIADVVTGL